MQPRTHTVLGRAAVAATAVAAMLAGGVASATGEAPPDPAPPVETGVVDGATVAVAAPPVPPTTAEVAVGLPPVPPTTAEVAVGLPPVPPTTVEVASAPPVPPPTTVALDPEVVAQQVTSLVVDAATGAARALRR